MCHPLDQTNLNLSWVFYLERKKKTNNNTFSHLYVLLIVIQYYENLFAVFIAEDVRKVN